VLLTGEADGYYADYADDPVARLGRCLAEGFAYQGEPSAFRDGAPRGEPSADLPPTAFVAFLQNHDQVGNRAYGERLTTLADPDALEAMTALLLLAPSVPLLFMGEEWGAEEPFLYFCDHAGELARAVTEGRRREFARFERFADPQARAAIPDPCVEETFRRSRPDRAAAALPRHARRLARVRALLALRHAEIVPRLAGSAPGAGCDRLGAAGLRVRWRLGDGSGLTLLANLGPEALQLEGGAVPTGAPLHAQPEPPDPVRARLAPWSVAWYLASP
jgi:malto-oligosyltrehalose trehalohydrolase